MPKGGQAVGTIYIDSEEGFGFINENFILIAQFSTIGIK
jgi:hypothetical protein